MSTIKSQRKLSADELLEAAAQLSQTELERLVSRLLVMQARYKAPSLSQRETELMLTINKGLPEEVHRSYRELIKKRREATLTEVEHKELIEIGDLFEAMNVPRIQALGELALLRGVSPRELMDKLGIKPVPVE